MSIERFELLKNYNGQHFYLDYARKLNLLYKENEV